MSQFYLTPVLGGPGAPRFPVFKQPQVIGRADTVDIPLLEPTVSRQHASVRIENDEVVLEDLGSKHGTFVNSERVTHVTLKPGDVVVFGLTLVLRLEKGSIDEAVDSTLGQPVPTMTGLPAVGPLVNSPTSVASTSPDPFIVRRLQDKIAAGRKLAAHGLLCAMQLPSIVDELKKSMRPLQASEQVKSAVMRESLSRVVERLNDLLTAMGTAPPQSEKVQLASVFDEINKVLATEASAHGVTLKIENPGALCANAHNERFIAALIELVRNAIRASKRGQFVAVSARDAGESVVVLVRDYGDGIPDELLARAFDPFVTLPGDSESLGIGLLLARQLLMSFGASMVLQSTMGSGTTVRIKLDSVQA